MRASHVSEFTGLLPLVTNEFKINEENYELITYADDINGLLQNDPVIDAACCLTLRLLKRRITRVSLKLKRQSSQNETWKQAETVDDSLYLQF